MKVKDLIKVLAPLEEVLGDYDVYYELPSGGVENIDEVCINSKTNEVRLL